MCCFAGHVKFVHWTKIFARLTGKSTQFLAYQMAYESEQANAMILPLPVSTPVHESSVRFIDLSEYEDFFQNLAAGFPYVNTFSLGCGAASDLADAGSIEMQKVGNFIASFVPTVDDFSRLDPQFVIPKETWDKIPIYSDYGFAVFQLHELAGRPHPMAFEFDTRSEETFFPTVHIHDGEVHATEEFNHVLYLQHAGLDSVVSPYRGPRSLDPKTQLARSKESATEFCRIAKTKGIVAPELLVHRKELQGTLPNQDTILSARGNPTIRSFNYRNWTWTIPWGVCVAAVAWFLRRRGRLKKRT